MTSPDVPSIDKIEKRLFRPASEAKAPDSIAPHVKKTEPKPSPAFTSSDEPTRPPTVSEVYDKPSMDALKDELFKATEAAGTAARDLVDDAKRAARAAADAAAVHAPTTTYTSTPVTSPPTWMSSPPPTAPTVTAVHDVPKHLQPLSTTEIKQVWALAGVSKGIAHSTPFCAPSFGDDCYSFVTRLTIDFSAYAADLKATSVSKIGKLFLDTTRNSAIRQDIARDAMLALGLSPNAVLGRINPDARRARNYVNLYRWLFALYNGQAFNYGDDVNYGMKFDEYDAAKQTTVTTPVYLDQEETFVSIEDVYVPTTPSKTSTSVPVVDERANPVTRPNGQLYFPRTVTFGGSTTLYDTEMLTRGRETGTFVLLYGPPGTGKTAIVDATFPDVITLPGTSDIEVSDFLGSFFQRPDGTYGWSDGPLVQAMTEGRPFFVDEIALIDSRAAAVLYSVMDGRDEIRITANPERGVVKAKDGFWVVAACNPDVPGAVMSEAMLSRFGVHVEVTTDYDTLETRLGIDPTIIIVAKSLAREKANKSISNPPQARELIAFQRNKDNFGLEFAIANLIASADPRDRAVYTSQLATSFSVSAVALQI